MKIDFKTILVKENGKSRFLVLVPRIEEGQRCQRYDAGHEEDGPVQVVVHIVLVVPII